MTTRKLLSILMLGMVGSSAFAIEPPVKPTPEAANAAEFVVGNKYYIRNVEAGQYLTGGNNWATQMSLTKDGLLDENNQAIIVMGIDSTAVMNTAKVPGVALQMQGAFTFKGSNVASSTKANTFIFRESATTGFVDHGTQAHGYIWDIEQIPGTNKYLLKTPAEDPDFGSTGTVAGVYKDAEGTEVTWAAEDDEDFGAEWEFVPADEYESLLKIYEARVSFYDTFNKAKEAAPRLKLTEEEAVYNNADATEAEIKAAEESVKAKLAEANVNTDKYVADQTFTSVDELDGQLFAISKDGNYFYGSNNQNLGYANGEAAFADGVSGYQWKIEAADGGFFVELVTPAGGDYSVWGSGKGYLNSQEATKDCCFILGKSAKTNGQDIDNGAVWVLEYNEEAQGFALKNVGTGLYLNASTAAANSSEPVFFKFTSLKENAPAAIDEAVLNTEDLIDAIGTVELTADSKAKIDAARAAYDELTDTQKADVQNLATLEAAEASYKALEDAANPEPLEPSTDGLIEIAQEQDDAGFPHAEATTEDGVTTYTAPAGALSVVIKMLNVDVKDCDYISIKFAEPTPAGLNYSFWNGQDNKALEAGITELKYVFSEDEKCAIENDVLPQIAIIGIYPGEPKTIKVAGVYKHQKAQDTPTEPEATAEDLTLDLFHAYASDAADAEQTGESATAVLKLDEVTDCPYGNTNVLANEYADLADYETLTIEVADGAPRLFFNQDASGARITVATANGADDPYIISAEDGVYVIDLAKIKEETGKVHLNGIKASSYNTTTTVSSIKVTKATDEPDQPVVDEAVEDVKSQIANLGEAELTDEYKVKLDAARAAYEELTDEQKANVDNLADLEAAEEAYKALEEAAQPEPTSSDKFVPDQTFASVEELEGQLFAISKDGNYFYGSGNQNLGYANGEAAFADGVTGYQWKIEAADGGYFVELVTPAGGDYNIWGSGKGYLNSQEATKDCCFILGNSVKTNGQDIDNGAVWTLEYNEEAQGFALKNVGTGLYLNASTAAANSETPVYFTISSLKENPNPAPVVDEAVDNAESLIDAIGDVELTDDCKAKIDAARAAYNELTEAQQAEVENIATLEAAEEAYKTLEEEANPDQPDQPALEEGLIEITQDQGKDLDTFTRTDLVEGDDYNTYTAHGDLQIAFKMMNLDVEGCDYVVVKFAEPVAAGWKLAFWSNQDLVDVPEGATEYKYVFDEDPKCGVTNGVLPQICMMTFFGAPSQLEAKVTGIYKHQKDVATGIDETESKTTVKNGVYMENGKIVIVKDGKKFTTGGVEIK